jgi:aryl-phospho-beta-D-glucosidase BglC (GH1 family)
VGTSSSQGNTGADWLHVEGNKVVDANGRAVWMTGVNWFGFNCTERVFHGLWSAHFPTMMKSIADHGLNTLRVPISVELILEWKAGVFKTPNVNTYANPELTGLNSLQIFDRTLELANQYGIKVLLDMHSAEADNSGHVYPLWTHGKFTEADFYAAWEWIAARYKTNDTLVAFDLKNEPHGKAFQETEFAIWDNSSASNNWKRVAQEAATRILAINPNVLILVEGIESYPKEGVPWTSRDVHQYYNTWWGGNLRGVTEFPVTVPGHQSQIMYSPHDYGPSVYDQPWFYEGFNMDTLIKDVWFDNWLYIHDKQIAPLLIGEWGGHMDAGRNQAWMTYLRDLMIKKKIHHTFWCLNPNSGDTGGLIGYDWATWDAAKYGLVKPSLWQLNNKFVGLDQDTPLGSGGLSVKQYYSAGGAEPIGN